MSELSHNGSQSGGERAHDINALRRRRTPWPLMVVAALFVIVPFLTWYTTWFGRELSDEKIEEYLTDGKPRHAQHALSQIAERISRKDQSARRWYPHVISLARNPIPDLRMTAAWVMGEEHSSPEFHTALLELVQDPEAIVRRNAALALVRFGDTRSRPELLAMLRPFTVRAHAAGTALTTLSVGTPVKRDSLLLRVRIAPDKVEEVRSPLPGKVASVSVQENASFEKDAELFVLAPDPEHVRDALIGLAFFGEREDLAEVERFLGEPAGTTEEVKKQAALTAVAIKRRSETVPRF